MSRVIQDSIADGSLVLWHDYRAGHFLDLSENGNDGTPTSAIWQKRGLRFPVGAAHVLVTDDASIQLVQGSIIAYGQWFDQVADGIIVSKEDIGGVNYRFSLLAGGGLSFFDGASTRTIVTTVDGMRSVGIVFENEETPEAFYNGLSAGNLSGDVALIAYAANLRIGSYFSNTVNIEKESRLDSLLMFNDMLTEAEMAQVYSELNEQGGPSS